MWHLYRLFGFLALVLAPILAPALEPVPPTVPLLPLPVMVPAASPSSLLLLLEVLGFNGLLCIACISLSTSEAVLASPVTTAVVGLLSCSCVCVCAPLFSADKFIPKLVVAAAAGEHSGSQGLRYSGRV
jgi:hypothetical protein